MPYSDFEVTFDGGNPVETDQMRYLEGFGLPAQQTVSTGATRYLHEKLGDIIPISPAAWACARPFSIPIAMIDEVRKSVWCPPIPPDFPDFD